MSTPKHSKTEEHRFDTERFQIRISRGEGEGRVEFVEKASYGNPGTTSWSGPYDLFLKQLETPETTTKRDIGLYAPGTK
jgi:hypothetical protein